MPVPRRYTTDAIVLSRFDLGEADRVLTLITPGGGKIKAIAKGVRRPDVAARRQPRAVRRADRGPGPRPDVRVVTQVSVGHAWLRLRDARVAATAWYLAELADRSLEERHAAEPLYVLLRRAYELLDAGMAPGRVARWYEMHLPTSWASRPRWIAASSATGSSSRTSGSAGCRRWAASCASAARARRTTGQACRSRRSSCSRPTSAWTSRRSPACGSAAEVEREVEAAMREFLRYALERDARSLAFLDEVRAVPLGR